jgi:hypothetical protein
MDKSSPYRLSPSDWRRRTISPDLCTGFELRDED